MPYDLGRLISSQTLNDLFEGGHYQFYRRPLSAIVRVSLLQETGECPICNTISIKLELSRIAFNTLNRSTEPVDFLF